MLSMSKSEIERLFRSAQSASARVKRIKEEANEMVDTVVATFETGGAAFTMGMINGRYGGAEIVGVPLDLLSGFGLHLLGFLGIGDQHLHNLGNGAFCSYTNTLGAGIGGEMKLKAEAAARAAGALPAGATAKGLPGALSSQQLADIAAGRATG
jgi:hypothetical protein